MNIIPGRFKTLIYWMKERENIRLMKEMGRGFVSDDPLMVKWRWCNVNRNHDRETLWIHKVIVEPNYNHPMLWFNLCIARFINWSPTLARLGYYKIWDPEAFCMDMALIMKEGKKAYTGAYMIRAGTGEDAKMPKHEYLVKRVFTPLWELRKNIPESQSCSDWDMFLSMIFGMGDFMRNQIITDLKYTRYLKQEDTIDWKTFCLAGPGTRRGMNRLYDLDLKQSWKEHHMSMALIELRKQVAREVKFKDYFDDLNNLANCLCEFDKYMRLTNGEGEPRATYKPSPYKLP